jgi:hypothetical protein
MGACPRQIVGIRQPATQDLRKVSVAEGGSWGRGDKGTIALSTSPSGTGCIRGVYVGALWGALFHRYEIPPAPAVDLTPFQERLRLFRVRACEWKIWRSCTDSRDVLTC